MKHYIGPKASHLYVDIILVITAVALGIKAPSPPPPGISVPVSENASVSGDDKLIN